MIKYENICLSFGKKIIFHDFSLEIAKGEKTVLLGKSGIGKSSLFALVLGFIQPQSGAVLFNKMPVDESSVWDVRQKIAFIDQDVSIGGYKVGEWFALVRRLKKQHLSDFGSNKIKKWMDFFELGTDLLSKEISELSGGERQRIAIIVAVLLNREVFLLDEATSALDANLKKKVVTFFTGLENRTVFSISHDAVWLESPSVKAFDLETGKWKQ